MTRTGERPTSPAQSTSSQADASAAQPAVVVVGVDGSAASEAALSFAVDEARRRGAVLRIVTGYELPSMSYGYAGAFDVGPVEDALRVTAEARLKLCADTAGAAGRGVVVETVVDQGRPSRILLEAAKDAALLVVGARGAGAFTHFMTGSTCTEVVHHAHVPVAVIPCPRQVHPAPQHPAPA